MQAEIRFRSIAYDTFPLSYKGREYRLFKDQRVENQNPITRAVEKEVVQWLFSKPNFIGILLDEIDEERIIQPFLELPRQTFDSSPEKDGDFDAIFCPPGRFESLTCIEFKGVKYDQQSPGDIPKINKLERLPKLIKQSRIARETGFHKTYAAVISLVDLSNIPHPNVLTKFNPQGDYKKIYDLQVFGPLDPDVGTLLIEIEQPTGSDFRRMGQINVSRLREAGAQKQPAKMIEEFREVFYRRANTRI
jgi:hypothetical protein